MTVPVRLGDSPPIIPLRKPFDLTPWQLAGAITVAVLTLNAEGYLQLSNDPFQEGSLISPVLAARLLILMFGAAIVLVYPHGRPIPMWLYVGLKHFWTATRAVYGADNDHRGPAYFKADAWQMTRMQLAGDSTVFVVDPPAWWFFKRTFLAQSWWDKHVPYRKLIPVEPEGALELMTDSDRQSRGAGLASGLKALGNPVQIVAQARPEDPAWIVERAMPPAGSPFHCLREPLRRWSAKRAQSLMQRRIIVACSAPTLDVLVEHVRDVSGMLTDAGLTVREINASDQQALFDAVYGARRFYPHSRSSFGIDSEDWVTIVVRHFPRHVVIGWVMYVIGSLPVDVSLYAEPDDAVWLTKIMEWFEGACMLQTADTAHRDALQDLQYVESKIKRNEDSIQRTTLLLTMPAKHVARVSNRLKKSGAIFRLATGEHREGRFATLPRGGLPAIGATRPLDGLSVAACYPFGSSGLRMDRGTLLGTARESPEAVSLDVLAPALFASMIAILGTTGAGKTFLMQMLIARSGLPFTLIDMKPHRDKDHYGDFYRFTEAAGGAYVVVTTALLWHGLPEPHPTAQCYNLALLNPTDRARALIQIAELEWARAVESLEDRIFGVDEVNALGQTEEGKEFIERVASQGRSVGFVGLFASQEVGDFLRDRRLAKSVTMSSMLFVLAQEKSQVDMVVETLGLGDAVRDELTKFQPDPGDSEAESKRYAILRAGRRVVSFQIEACPEEAALFTTRPSDKRQMRLELVAA